VNKRKETGPYFEEKFSTCPQYIEKVYGGHVLSPNYIAMPLIHDILPSGIFTCRLSGCKKMLNRTADGFTVGRKQVFRDLKTCAQMLRCSGKFHNNIWVAEKYYNKACSAHQDIN
jgi:hypothetical protein